MSTENEKKGAGWPTAPENPFAYNSGENKTEPEPRQKAEPAPKADKAPAAEPWEPTGVENVRHEVSADAGMPRNPSTPADAVNAAFTPPSKEDDEFEGYDAENYGELIEQLKRRMEASRPLTKEEEEALRRRQRTQGIIAGISDAAQAVANLGFTSNYAPDMFDPKAGMSAKARERFDREKARHDADNDRYMNYALQLGKLRDRRDAAREKRQQQNVTLQLKLNEDARRQAKAAHDAAMADIDLQIGMGKLDYEQARAEKAKADAKLAKAYADHADEKVIAEINSKNRSNRGGGGGGTPGQYTVWRVNPDSGEVEYKSGFKAEAAARNYATTYAKDGWNYSTNPVEVTTSRESTDRRGRKSKSETKSSRDPSTPANEAAPKPGNGTNKKKNRLGL
ncbi:MAG: hypothetical protein NC210_09680 [[Clostridium] fimetarium]|nr:hypothetical protein [Alistipes timonensis]MCM1406679.1 hypothetical protein [[Clostridium] fimetarium]